MLMMIETKDRIQKNLKLAGWVALMLISAGGAAAWDDGFRPSVDSYRTGLPDTGSVGAAYSAELHVDPNGAVIRHRFDVVALFAAVIGDVGRPYVGYRPEYRSVSRHSPHTHKIVHETFATRHRHHNGCRHPGTAWRAGRHHTDHSYAHSPHHGHRRYHSKGRGHH